MWFFGTRPTDLIPLQRTSIDAIGFQRTLGWSQALPFLLDRLHSKSGFCRANNGLIVKYITNSWCLTTHPGSLPSLFTSLPPKSSISVSTAPVFGGHLTNM